MERHAIAPLTRACRAASGGLNVSKNEFLALGHLYWNLLTDSNGSTLVAFKTVFIHRVTGETDISSMIEGVCGMWECAIMPRIADRWSTVYPTL